MDSYRPSGRIGVMTMPWWLIALAVVAPCAFVYQFLLEWIPLIYLNFLLTLGVAAGVGYAARLVVTRGKVRNVMVGVALGLTIGLAMIAAKFWFQKQAMLPSVIEAAEEEMPADADREAFRRQISQSFGVWYYMQIRAEQGWAIGRNGLPVTGLFVWLVWSIELVVVCGGGAKMGRTAARRPFHEGLQLWASEEEQLLFLPADAATVARVKAARDANDFVKLPEPAAEMKNQFLRYKMFSIPGHDREAAYLSIIDVTITIDKDGNRKEKEIPIFEFAAVTPLQRALLEEAIEKITGVPESEPE